MFHRDTINHTGIKNNVNKIKDSMDGQHDKFLVGLHQGIGRLCELLRRDVEQPIQHASGITVANKEVTSRMEAADWKMGQRCAKSQKQERGEGCAGV